MESTSESSPRTPHVSNLAVASLVLSCLGVCLCPFVCLAGIICGHLARAQIRKAPDVLGGGIALTGLLVGYVDLVVALLAMLAYIFLPFIMQQMR